MGSNERLDFQIKLFENPFSKRIKKINSPQFIHIPLHSESEIREIRKKDEWKCTMFSSRSQNTPQEPKQYRSPYGCLGWRSFRGGGGGPDYPGPEEKEGVPHTGPRLRWLRPRRDTPPVSRHQQLRRFARIVLVAVAPPVH